MAAVDDTYAPNWTAEQRDQWKAAYIAGRPVLLPHAEHDTGECSHCDLLRALMREAEDEQSRAPSGPGTTDRARRGGR